MMYEQNERALQEAVCLLMKYCQMSEVEASQYIEMTACNSNVHKEIIISQVIHIYD